jgi:hypothetical protein
MMDEWMPHTTMWFFNLDSRCQSLVVFVQVLLNVLCGSWFALGVSELELGLASLCRMVRMRLTFLAEEVGLAVSLVLPCGDQRNLGVVVIVHQSVRHSLGFLLGHADIYRSHIGHLHFPFFSWFLLLLLPGMAEESFVLLLSHL